jgi:hypothetical protein
LLGTSYDLRDECKKYILLWNDTIEKYKEHLYKVENSFKLKMTQFREFHDTLGECLDKLAYI